jgi:hypothetical protein
MSKKDKKSGKCCKKYKKGKACKKCPNGKVHKGKHKDIINQNKT